MQTKIGTKSKALVFLLSFAMVMSFLVTVGQKDDWRAYAADAANAKYSLAGAEYWVYTNSGCTTRAKDADGNNAVLTTKADGTTNEVELEEGTYYVKEKSASRGYILDSTVYTVKVNADETTWVNGSPGVKETPQSAPFSLQKVDWDTGRATPATGAEFEGAEFEVKYTDGASVTRTWILRADSNGLVNLDNSHFVSGDTRYKNSQNQFVVPLGTVTVKETKAPAGYAKSDEVYTITIGWDGASATSETTTNVSGSGSKGGSMDTNPIKVKYREKKQSVPFKIQKVDKETGKASPMGGAKFNGATFELKCTAGEDNGKTWVLKADENGVADLAKATGAEVYKNSAGEAALKLGSYTLKETAAPEGYLLNSGTFTFSVDGNTGGTEYATLTEKSNGAGGTLNKKSNTYEFSFPDQVKRGDAHWNKMTTRVNARLDVPFLITSKTTGEKHVAFAGEKGQFFSTSEYNPHTQKTNANDAILNADGTPKLDANGWVDASLLDSEAGIWFYKDKNGNEGSPVNDDLGAFPYDEYIIEELPCEANDGYVLLKNIEMSITRDGWDRDEGTLTNEPDVTYDFYKVRNEDAASNGKGKYGFQPGDYVTYDVTVENKSPAYKLTVDVSDEFTEGAEYFSKPVVVDVKNATQKKLSDDKNTVRIEVDVKQTAVVTYGAVVMPNAVEYLADAAKDSDSKKGEKDCNHVDRDNEPDEADGYRNFAYATNAKFTPVDGGTPIDGPEKDDDAQTPIKEPKIGTYLADNAGRKIVSGEKVELVDTVKYEGLTPGKTYVFEGSLIVKDSGDPLVENGKKVSARSEEFVPTEANGETTVKFTVDAKGIMGKELVAFETAYKVKEEDGSKPKDENGEEVPEVEVAKHEDPEDEAQTVEVPGYEMYKIRNEKASAKGKKFGFEPGSSVTYDVVIKNTSKTASIKMDVTDQFTEGADYFTKPVVIGVEGAEENSRSEDENKVNITIKAGETATVTFAAEIKESAKEYLAAAAKDSDSLDKDGKDTNKSKQENKTDDQDGYRNIAKVENPVPEDPEDPDPENPNPPLPPDEDESQTPVKEPEIGTFLADDAERKVVNPSGSTVLIDTVNYEGLTPGQKYAVVGALIMKDTTDPLVENGEPVKAVGTFTAEKPNGVATVEFVVDTAGVVGKEIVAFETCYNITGTDLPDDPAPEDVEENGKKVAEHKDPKDPSQTIKVKEPKIGTFLADDAERKEVDPSGKTVLIDTVAYKGLEPGHEYAVIGELILKDTADPLVENGKKVQAAAKFIPEDESGVAEVEFVIDTRGLKGKEIVAFETAYSVDGLELPDNPTPDQVTDGGKKVAEHKDLNDPNQIVYVKNPEEPGTPHRSTPRTGDQTMLFIPIALLIASAAGIGAVAIRRRKRTSERQSFLSKLEQ